LYNSAFDRKWQQLAPGMVLVAEDIQQAIEEGCEVFDFLKGDYAYKYRFGARKRLVRRLVGSRR
jgi:CelD/BcsL family acetyltransferase involved in cellulose biosynthesis